MPYVRRIKVIKTSNGYAEVWFDEEGEPYRIEEDNSNEYHAMITLLGLALTHSRPVEFAVREGTKKLIEVELHVQ